METAQINAGSGVLNASAHATFVPEQVSGSLIANGTFIGKASNESAFKSSTYLNGTTNSSHTVVAADFERSNRLLEDARKTETKPEERYNQLAEAVRLLVLAVFGLFLNLSIVVVGLPIQWTYVRLVRLGNFCGAVRNWLQVPLLPRLLDFVAAVVTRVYSFAVWVVETVLRRPGLVHNTQTYFAGVWQRALQQRGVYETYYSQKRADFFSAVNRSKDQLVSKKNETVQRLNESATQVVDSTKKEAYVLLNKSHQLVQERKDIPARRYAAEIAQLGFVILLHVAALVTNLVAYPVVVASQRASSLYSRKNNSRVEVVTLNANVLKKTE